MMKRQISKKKLERMTIHGGDYRKAGMREGSAISIQGLKELLEDDVKNLSRMETAGSSLEDGLADISERELERIMDRRLLFSISTEVHSGLENTLDDTEKLAVAEFLNNDHNGLDCSSVPIEGEMYDIVLGCEGTGFLSSIS